MRTFLLVIFAALFLLSVGSAVSQWKDANVPFMLHVLFTIMFTGLAVICAVEFVSTGRHS